MIHAGPEHLENTDRYIYFSYISNQVMRKLPDDNHQTNPPFFYSIDHDNKYNIKDKFTKGHNSICTVSQWENHYEIVGETETSRTPKRKLL